MVLHTHIAFLEILFRHILLAAPLAFNALAEFVPPILPSVNASDYILYFNQNFVLFGDTVNKYKNSLRHVILLKS